MAKNKTKKKRCLLPSNAKNKDIEMNISKEFKK